MHAMFTEILIRLNMKWTGLRVCLLLPQYKTHYYIPDILLLFSLTCFILILSWGFA